MMKFKLIFLVLIIISCKAAKERKACFELVNKNEKLDINTFNELRDYIKKDKFELSSSVWIIDGMVVDSIESIINNKNFDLLTVDVLDGDKIDFSCRRVSAYIIISTNNCLMKSLEN